MRRAVVVRDRAGSRALRRGRRAAAVRRRRLPGLAVRVRRHLLHRHLRPQHPHGLHGPDLARPRRVHGSRRLHDGDPRGEGGFPYWTTIPLAGIVAGVAGLLLAIPALRLSGLYLALATFGLALAAPALIKKYPDLTGGSTGLSFDLVSAPSWLDLSTNDWFYYLSWSIALVLLVPPGCSCADGRVARSAPSATVRWRPCRSASTCRRTRRCVLGHRRSTRASRARCSPSSTSATWSPETFSSWSRSRSWSWSWSAGLATVAGALFGALLIVFVPVWSSDVNEVAVGGHLRGRTLIACMYVIRSGIKGLLRPRTLRWSRSKGQPRGGSTMRSKRFLWLVLATVLAR